MKKTVRRIGSIPYRYKIFLSLLLVSVAPLLLCGGLFYYTAQQTVRDNLVQTKQAQLRQVKQDLEGQMQVYEHITDYLLSIQSLWEVLSLEPDQIYERYQGYRDVVDPLLETNKYYHPVIRTITIYLKNIDIEHGTTIAPLEQLGQKDWYREKFADGVPKKNWVVSVEDNSVYYVRPVSQYGQMMAVLVTSFDYDEFLNGLDVVSTFSEECVYLLSEDRKIVYADEEQVLGTAFLPGEEDTGRAVREESMEETGWKIVGVVPDRVISMALKRTVKGSILLLILCMVCAVITSAILARALVHRTVKLNNLVRQIGKGEAKAEREILDGYDGPMDEIGVLINNTRQMVHRLDELKITVYKEKIARRDLEMKALQAQINPHFLYNSLSIINWKALDAGADEVSQITLKLADFYRTTLNRGSSMISVSGEIRNIRSYLDIQLIMHDDNFRVEWDLDKSVMNWQMPKLVLQPLVENALEHGLDLKEDDDRLLYIRIAEEKENLILTVRDNGVGMTQEKADSLIHYDSKGYGVKNVNERISLLYEKTHVFRITSNPGRGTEIYIRIPGERSGDI